MDLRALNEVQIEMERADFSPERIIAGHSLETHFTSWHQKESGFKS